MLDKLRRRIPDATDDALLQDMLDDARCFMLAYTGRETLPAALFSAQIELAAVFYNRLGMEGEKEHSEGGIQRVADAVPEEIRRQLNRYRLAKAVS